MSTFAKFGLAKSRFALFLLVLMAFAAPALTSPAWADAASDHAAVDAAKASGAVGEQADGYLGFVKGSADAVTTTAVNNINAGRADLYAQTAAKTGVTRDAAGQATGALLLEKLPAGQYFKPLAGGWTKK